MIKTKTENTRRILGGLFTALMAVGAYIQVSIPVEPVPMHFTMQFFFVLLSGFLLGGRGGAFSAAIYLLTGLCGVPVFASGGGLSYLLRPTFGFLFGFIPTAGCVGWLVKKARPRTVSACFLISLAGFACTYLFGMVYFYFVSNYILQIPVTWKLVFVNCFLLTAAGDILLCFLAAVVVKRVSPLLDGGLSG